MLDNYKGRKAIYLADGLEVAVTLKGARSVFGHIDYYIETSTGSGKWATHDGNRLRIEGVDY